MKDTIKCAIVEKVEAGRKRKRRTRTANWLKQKENIGKAKVARRRMTSVKKFITGKGTRRKYEGT